MIDALDTQALLGPLRGEPAVDRTRLAEVLVALSALAMARPDVVAVDVNPLIVVRRRAGGGRRAGRGGSVTGPGAQAQQPTARWTAEHFQALFDPRGVVVAGASTHPGKFGFVSLHNLLAAGYQGRVFGTNLEGQDVLGVPTVASIDELPEGEADLVFVCTPAAANARAAAGLRPEGHQGGLRHLGRLRGGGRAGPAGPGRAGRARRRARDPPGRAQRPGARLDPGAPVRADRGAVPARGPDRRGQPERQLRVVVHELRPPDRGRHQPGRVGRQRRRRQRGRLPEASTPRIRPPPSAWPTSRASATERPSRPASARPPARKPAGAGEGRRHRRRPAGRSQPHRRAGQQRPRVRRRVPPGRRDAGGDRRGGVRGRGDLRHPAAPGRTATSWCSRRPGDGASSPRTPSPATATSALLPLPEDLRVAIDAKLPPRWSRANPVDCAGGETRDTIPEVMALVAEHPDVHAVVYLGPRHPVEPGPAHARPGRSTPATVSSGSWPTTSARTSASPKRRPRSAIGPASRSSRRPSSPWPTPTTPGRRPSAASGRLCYASADRAVTALGHLYRYGRWRQPEGPVNGAQQARAAESGQPSGWAERPADRRGHRLTRPAPTCAARPGR